MGLTAPVWITGFNYGLATPTANGGGLCNTVSGTPAIQSTIKRAGGYALEINPSGSTAEFILKNLSTPTVCSGSLYFYFDTLPSASDIIVWLSVSAGGYLGFRWVSTDGKIHARMVGGSDGNAPDIVISVDTWYRLDFEVDVSANPSTVDFSITPDGGSTYTATQTTYAQAATTFTSIRIGTYTNTTTCLLYFTDVVVSTAADYPIYNGDHGVEGLRPGSDGTHNLGGNISNEDGGTTNLYDRLDEDPWITTYNDDLVRQTANGTGNYAEILFADTSQTTILGARAILQYAGETTSANRGACIIIDEDATETEVWGNPTTTQDYSEGSAFYKSKILPTPSGGWDQAAVNALKTRIGYSGDASPDPYWLAMIIEVAYVPVSGVTLTVNDAAHALAADAIALTQAHTLAMQDGTHAQTVDPFALTQQHTLAVAEALHAHASDPITLTESVLLAVQEALHGHTAEAVAIIQQHVLGMSDGLHGLSTDPIDLVQQRLLAIAEAFHAHSADSVDLIQDHLLAIADALHAHTAENVALDVSSVLEVADATHAHTADALDLFQAHLLAVAEAAHVQTADNIDLITAGILQVANALHAHAADSPALIQAHLLNVAEALHGHSAENVVLIMETVLTVADAVHQHAADAIKLIEDYLLAVEEAAHGHAAESPVLTQAHLLAIQEALHVLRADNVVLEYAGEKARIGVNVAAAALQRTAPGIRMNVAATALRGTAPGTVRRNAPGALRRKPS